MGSFKGGRKNSEDKEEFTREIINRKMSGVMI